MMEKSFLSQERLTSFRLGMIATLLIYLAWISFAPPQPLRTVAAFSLLLLFRGSAAAAVTLLIRRSDRSKDLRPWNYLAISLWLWFAADAITAAYLVTQGAYPSIPGPGEVVRLAGYFSFLVMLGFFSIYQKAYFYRLRSLLTNLILALTMISLQWMIVFEPAFALRLARNSTVFWTLIFPTFDLTLLSLFILPLLLSRQGRERTGISLLALGLLSMMISSFYYAFQILLGRGQQLGGTEVGWMAASYLFLWGIQQWVGEGDSWKRDQPGGEDETPLRGNLENLLPIAATYLVVGYTAMDWVISGQLDGVGLGSAVLLSLMLVARQGVLLGQKEFRHFLSLVQSTSDFAFLVDSEGRLSYVNPRMREQLDLEMKQSPLNLADLTRSGLSGDLIEQAMDNGWSGEVELRSTTGKWVPVHLTLQPIRAEQDAPPTLAGTGHDLTHIKLREKELKDALQEVAQAREELEALNAELETKVLARTLELETIIADLRRVNQELTQLDRLKDEFVTLVSHELRSPLANIRGGVDFILDSDAEIREAYQEELMLVRSEIERLSELVENILDLSTLEAGQFPLFIEEVNLYLIAQHVCQGFPTVVGGGRLDNQIPTDFPPVLADESALHSVMQHLVDNALKYAPEGPIVIHGRLQGNRILVSVADSGPGIPEEERERIFDMFHRLDSRDSREVYGFGLGLHLTSRFLKAMGGGIRVDGSNTGGAKFTFWLPVADGETGSKKGKPASKVEAEQS